MAQQPFSTFLLQRRAGSSAQPLRSLWMMFWLAPCLLGSPAAQASPPSLEADFGALIGGWTCLVSEAGKPDSRTEIRYEWMYDRRVLKETIRSPAWSGEFMTTLDKRSGTYKGVAVDSSGAYVVWENPGFENGRSSEVGYQFRDGRLIPVSRTDFEWLGHDHYVIHDFMADTAGGKGAPTDIEDCVRVS